MLTTEIASLPGPLPPPLPLEGTDRFVAGLAVTGLLEDLRGGPHTLLAPTDDAFDRLPWTFDRMLSDPDLVEARFDLFEYHVLRGTFDARGPKEERVTVHGETLRLGSGLVFGRYGAARILRTTTWHGARVHVIDQCVFPVFPRVYLVASGSARAALCSP